MFHSFTMIESNSMEDLPGGSVFHKDKDGAIYLTYADFGDGKRLEVASHGAYHRRGTWRDR